MNEATFLQQMSASLASIGTRLSVVRTALVGPLEGDAIVSRIDELAGISAALMTAAETLAKARTQVLLAELEA